MLEARNKRSIIHRDSLSPGSGSLQPADLVGAAKVHQELGLLLLLEPEEGDEDVEVVVTLLHPVHRPDNLAEEIQYQRENIPFSRKEIQFPKEEIQFPRRKMQFDRENPASKRGNTVSVISSEPCHFWRAANQHEYRWVKCRCARTRT